MHSPGTRPLGRSLAAATQSFPAPSSHPRPLGEGLVPASAAPGSSPDQSALLEELPAEVQGDVLTVHHTLERHKHIRTLVVPETPPCPPEGRLASRPALHCPLEPI